VLLRIDTRAKEWPSRATKVEAQISRKIMSKLHLKGLKVAILITNGFEQVELEQPRKASAEHSKKSKGERENEHGSK
jgi:hypothetical protein